MSSQKTILDDLGGFEFEKLMMDVFRNLGYENIRNPGQTGDEGRDIIMEKTVDGVRTTFIVECKNYSTNVGRPVIQKLHSAVSTFETDNVKQGMVVTTNGFSQGAREYAEKLDIDLWGGKKIRQIADDIGLDVYNGQIEILCNDSLPIPDKREEIEQKVRDELSTIRNFDKNVVDDIEVHLELLPALSIETEVDSTLETTVGVVNKIQEEETLIWRGDVKREDKRKDRDFQELVGDARKPVSIENFDLSQQFDNVEKIHFDKTETEFKQDVIKHELSEYTEDVSYTGKNNVTYNKTHKPKQKDVNVTLIDPVYVPKIKSDIKIKDHSHRYHYLTDDDLDISKKDDLHRDTVTGNKPLIFTPTLCQYCGTINNRLNIKNERLEHEPICKHCSTKKRFMLRKRYFKNQENLEKFEQKYEERPVYSKLAENKLGITSIIAATTYALLML